MTKTRSIVGASQLGLAILLLSAAPSLAQEQGELTVALAHERPTSVSK